MSYQFELEKKSLWALGIGALLLSVTLFFLGFLTAMLINRPLLPTVAAVTPSSNLKPPATIPKATEIAPVKAQTTAPTATTASVSGTASTSVTAIQLAVQVGTFTDLAQAKQMTEQLKKQGFSPMIVPQTGANNQQTSIVEVGPFSAWDEATQVAQLIGHSLGLRPAIRPML